MKKLISIILSLLLVMTSCVMVFAQSETPAKINLNVSYDQGVKVGETLTVTISTANNPGLCGVQFVLGYDKSVLQCTDASVGDVLSGTMNVTNKDNNEGVAVVAASATTINKNGTIATIKFKVLKEGKYNFKFNQMIIADYDCNDISVTSVFPAESNIDDPSDDNPSVEPNEEPQDSPSINEMFKSFLNKIKGIIINISKLEIGKNFVIPSTVINLIQKMLNGLI